MVLCPPFSNDKIGYRLIIMLIIELQKISYAANISILDTLASEIRFIDLEGSVSYMDQDGKPGNATRTCVKGRCIHISLLWRVDYSNNLRCILCSIIQYFQKIAAILVVILELIS
jgi:hypothetical protein